MATPVEFIKDFDYVKTKGPFSIQAIMVGIEHLSNMTKCVCAHTPDDFKHGIADQLNLGNFRKNSPK